MEEAERFGSDDLAVPDNPWELEEYRQLLLATAKSQKLKERQLKAEQANINEKWTSVLATELDLEARPKEPKSYPCRKLFPSSEDEELAPRQKGRAYSYKPNRPPRGREWAEDSSSGTSTGTPPKR